MEKENVKKGMVVKISESEYRKEHRGKVGYVESKTSRIPFSDGCANIVIEGICWAINYKDIEPAKKIKEGGVK